MRGRAWRTPILCAVALVASMVAITGTALSGPGASPAAHAAAPGATTAYDGLTVRPFITSLIDPVAVQFAPGGGVYVAEKRGVVKRFDGQGDTSATTVLDLQTEVYNSWDRGLVGLAVDPAFDAGRPFIYVLYTWDREPYAANTSVPRWGDRCPSPPGATTDGCPVSAKLVRYRIESGVAVPGSATVLLDGLADPDEGWCNQFPSHSIGTVEFGPDGMLYVGAGDGANFDLVDWGQHGGSAGSSTPINPCRDNGLIGTAPDKSVSVGGALRAQSVRAGSSAYQTWDGAILRIDPVTGAAAAGNPLRANDNPADDRIVAYGLRNPFRFGFRPGSDELWVGDVGWGTYEEINRFQTGPGQAPVPNFGWPCYEGPGLTGAYDARDLGTCESLYGSNLSTLRGGVESPLVAPYKAWPRAGVQPAPGCGSSGGGSVTGGVFVENQVWPERLRGAYVFADYVRGCVAALPLGPDGEPDPAGAVRLVGDIKAVDFETGPGNDVYVVDILTDTIYRIGSVEGNEAPVAWFAATSSDDPIPLDFTFDAAGTVDPDGDKGLIYTWDLDGDGACDDGNGRQVKRHYPTHGPVTVTLCATDPLGEQDQMSRTIVVGRSAPTITSMTSSAQAAGWAVGDTVTTTATATDASGTLPPDSYTWRTQIMHCSAPGALDACHEHDFEPNDPGYSFAFTGPDHEFYAFVRVTLTVTNSYGLSRTKTLDLKSRIASVDLRTEPAGIKVAVAGTSGPSPQRHRFIEGGRFQLTAPEKATVGEVDYVFAGWADGSQQGTDRTGVATGDVVYTARYRATSRPASSSGGSPTMPPAQPPGGSAAPRATYFSDRALPTLPRGRVLVGDFAGDRTDDVLVARRRRATLLTNKGDGGFTTTRLRGRSLAHGVVGDFAGDNRDEVLFHAKNGEARVWRLDGRPRSTTRAIARVSRTRVPRGASAYLLDHDRHADEILMRSRGGRGTVVAFRWSRGRLVAASTILRVPRKGHPVVGDFDRNGTADLVWRREAKEWMWLMRRQSGRVVVARRLAVGSFPGRPLAGRFDGSGGDQLWYHGASGDTVAHLAPGGVVAQTVTSVVAGAAQVVPGRHDRVLDIRRDGLTVLDLGDDGRVIETGNVRPPGAVAIPGDFDGSANGDVLWVSRTTGSRLYLRNS